MAHHQTGWPAIDVLGAAAVLQRANTVMGTNWSLHDFRHTAIDRMTADPTLTLPEVMAVTRHRRLASLAPYLRPRSSRWRTKCSSTTPGRDQS